MRLRTLHLLLLCAVAIGCGGGEQAPPPPAEDPAPDAATAEGTVQIFFTHLNDGRSEQALALYTDEARQALEDPEVFGSWVKQVTRDGTLRTVRIVSSSPQAGYTTVDFDLVYEDGTEVRRSVQVQGGEGQWKMGLIL
jgi:hypothetical protein